ncbi:HWE histidine kinase domain-containing protein [Roseomonas sp. 18066]|uniref:HWE histidine kinase domain-containing protein n=1 Tax=Roseomonas sp. 18066 TaxID=2681412 RepID=UPI001357C46E|nr:HWE histidine kinase domain-containing protein [Roseomonas sp. 18066]
MPRSLETPSEPPASTPPRPRWRLLATLAAAAAPGAAAGFLLGLQARGVAAAPALAGAAGPFLYAGFTGLMTMAAGGLAAVLLDVRAMPRAAPPPVEAPPEEAPPPLPAAAPPARVEAARGLIDAVTAAQSQVDRLRGEAALVEGLDDGVFALDAEAVLRFANPAALAVWARPAEAVSGQPLFVLFPSLRDSPLSEALKEVVAQQQPRRLEAVLAPFGGDVLLGLAPAPGGVTVRFRDLARLRAAEAALKAAEAKLQMALEGAGMASWDLDIASGEMRWTPRLFDLLGLPRSAGLLGHVEDWLALVHPKDAAAVKEGWFGAHRNAARFRSLHRVLRRDGEQRWLEAYGSITGDAARGRFMGVVHDVTARQQAEERLHQLSREIDHRAKNVLFTIQAIIRLTPKQDPERFATAVDGRIAALARAHQLLAREGWSAVSLRDLALGELSVCGPDAAIDLAGPSVLVAPVAVQPLAVVLHELAVNAVAHGALSRPGGSVTLRWAPQPEGALLLTWQERGGPVLAGAPARKGLGRRVIDSTVADQLEGQIGHNWEPAGLTSRITLPAARFELPWQAAEPAPAPAPRPATPPALARAVLQGARILVVEDEPMIGAALTAMLVQFGCSVAGPVTGLETALKRVLEATEPFDLALVDVNLNGRESFPVAELLAGRGVPVIYLTGYAELPEERLALAAGMLRKPVDPRELQTAIGRVLALQGRGRA